MVIPGAWTTCRLYDILNYQFIEYEISENIGELPFSVKIFTGIIQGA